MKDILLKLIIKATAATGLEQFFAIGKLAIVPSAFIFAMQRITSWYTVNEAFIQVVLGVLILDHIIGSYVHLRIKKDFTIEENITGLIKKLVVITASYYVLESIHFVLKAVPFISGYFEVIIQVSILIYPALPLLKNLSLISDGRFPPKWLFKSIEDFNQKGDLKAFKKTKKDDHEP